MSRADRRRGDRDGRRPTKRDPEPARAASEKRTPTSATAPAKSATSTPGRATAALRDVALVERIGFFFIAAVFVFVLARMLEARITWYLAVDQFGYLQFAHDLLRGKIFHDWEPATIMGILPKRTDILAQTYIWDNGRIYCRYAPGFPIVVAGWIALFGDARVSFLNPTIYIGLLGMVTAFGWRLTGSPWRGLAAAVLIALCPTRMYWWSLTLTRDLCAHLFAFIGLYQLLPRETPLTRRRAVVAGLGLGFAASVRNDAVLYLLPATLLALFAWRRERPAGRRVAVLIAGATAGLLIGLLPTLSFNAITTGNPFRPTQGMEVERFFVGAADEVTMGRPHVAYPSGMWRGTAFSPVSGGGLRLENFARTAPREWQLIYEAYGPVLIGFAALGVLVALVLRPVLVLMTVPYVVVAFLFYSCWFRYDPRYITGIFCMVPLLIVEGVVGSIELVRSIAERRGAAVARPIAVVLAIVALIVAVAPIAPPPLTPDAVFLSKGVLPVLMTMLPLVTAAGAAMVAIAPGMSAPAFLAPAFAIMLAVFGMVRAEATRAIRAPFQARQAATARATLQRTLERRSVVITSEDIGRPAENIEYYGGFYALYLTDLERWKIRPSQVALSFISAGVRPYLLLDRPIDSREAQERSRVFADLVEHGFTADRVVLIPPDDKMKYFVAAPMKRVGADGQPVPSELFRIAHPKWEQYLKDAIPAFR